MNSKTCDHVDVNEMLNTWRALYLWQIILGSALPSSAMLLRVVPKCCLLYVCNTELLHLFLILLLQ